MRKSLEGAMYFRQRRQTQTQTQTTTQTQLTYDPLDALRKIGGGQGV